VKSYKKISSSFTSGSCFDLEKILKSFPFYSVLDEASRDRPQINPVATGCSQNLELETSFESQDVSILTAASDYSLYIYLSINKFSSYQSYSSFVRNSCLFPHSNRST
jgi:hypothetical protein